MSTEVGSVLFPVYVLNENLSSLLLPDWDFEGETAYMPDIDIGTG